ncbi:MAG: GNAT family N-acetyltransferase [Lysinibacillus sp.]
MDSIKSCKDSIMIREIGRDDFQQYGRLYTKGFGMPAFLAENVAANNEVLLDMPGWHFFIVSIGQRDVGTAALFITGDVAVLAASAVIPEGRNQKVHQALIDYRLQMAKGLGCQLACGHAKFASISQNNMERCGLKLAYLKNIWQEAPVQA